MESATFIYNRPHDSITRASSPVPCLATGVHSLTTVLQALVSSQAVPESCRLSLVHPLAFGRRMGRLWQATATGPDPVISATLGPAQLAPIRDNKDDFGVT